MKVTIFSRVCCVLLMSSLFPSAVFANQDTNLRLQQRDELSARQTERAFIEDELNKEAEAASITVNGQTYEVGNTLHELGQALHLAVQSRQWFLAQDFLTRYQAIPGHDMLLVHYAKGAIFRQEGQFSASELEYRALLDSQPDFLPGQLELARVLFDNQKNRDALQLFERVDSALPPDNPRAQGVRNTIDSFVNALNHRDTWQGAFSFGPSFSDNLNQSSESYTCLLRHASGICLMDRVTPEAESATGIDFDASLNKRFSLEGHHGISFRGLSYGSVYNNHAQFNEHTLIASLGYSFHSAENRFSLSPQVEYNASGNHALFVSAGLKADWVKNISAKSAFKFEGEVERQTYRPKALDYQSDWQWSSSMAYWHQVSKGWLLFGGVDWTKKENEQKVHEYQLIGGRFGVNKGWDTGVDVSVFSSLRERKYGGFSAVLDEKREDKEQNYTVVLAAKKWSVYGFSPLLTWQHTQVSSNVDWLYSYRKNQYSIKLEKRF